MTVNVQVVSTVKTCHKCQKVDIHGYRRTAMICMCLTIYNSTEYVTAVSCP